MTQDHEATAKRKRKPEPITKCEVCNQECGPESRVGCEYCARHPQPVTSEFVRGLERAKEIAETHWQGYSIEWWAKLIKTEIYTAGNRDVANAIAAEIAKAGKP